MHRPLHRFLSFSLLALLTGIGLTGCRPPGNSGANDGNEEQKEQAIPVETVTLERGPIESIIKQSWYLEAERNVRVLARTSNRVKELLVEEGDEVNKDDVLARLEDYEQKTAVARAQTSHEKMKAEFERVETLYGQNLVSEQVYTDTKFELQNLKLSVDDAVRQLEYTEIRAPISGTVTKRLINLGDLVTANMHVFDIIDFSSIVAYIPVPDKNLPEIELNQPVRITTTSMPDREFKGYIKRIAPVVEAKSGSVKVTVGVKDYEYLRPGMFVEVEIVTSTKDHALLIPKSALVYDGDQRFVYRLKPGTRRVERLLVIPELEDRLHVEPAQGFEPGDEIVAAGKTGLKDNALVRLPGDPKPDSDQDGEAVNGSRPKAASSAGGQSGTQG